MKVTVGTRLGAYEISALLGKGGMGEVYRAHDTKLKRDVAIKILPSEFSQDDDRLSRFQREAEVLASLNHPNIAAIYDLQEANETRFLVLELVEGETLAERIERGPVPVEEALKIGYSICEGLEAAHEKGIIHRDLKPGNIKITPDGKVKVLDFGLAKALDAAPRSESLSNSPTLTIAGTQAGMILGTAAYMSPEQAKGFNTDQRSDIFSFGAVLYEMLTGRQAFRGDNVSEILASILAREPDFTAMPQPMNSDIARLLRRCLEKNPRRRWYAVGDLRLEIESTLSDPTGTSTAQQNIGLKRPALLKRAIPVALAVFVSMLITALTMWYMRPQSSETVTRFPITLGQGQIFTLVARRELAISPDGTQIAYVANQRLYLRSMSALEDKPVPGGESPGGAPLTDPVFSPDGQWIAFHSSSDRLLKKVAVTGGAAIPICSLDRAPFGVSWSTDGIFFAQANKGILRVSPNGGKPELIVSIEPDETVHGPQMLPGGEAVLFTLVKGTPQSADQWDKAQIVVQPLKTGKRTVVLEGGTDGHYLPTGHLVYAYGTTLLVVPFDARRFAVTGPQVPIVEGVRRTSTTGAAQFSFSDSGTLIYIPGTTTGQLALTVMDRQANVEPVKLPTGTYVAPRISPDGKSVAFGMDDGREANIWIYDLTGTTSMRRLTYGGANRYPIWTRDGKRIAFQSDREGDVSIFWQTLDSTATAQRLTKAEKGLRHVPDSWSPDDRYLSFTANQDGKGTIRILSLKDGKDSSFAEASSASLSSSAFSPDQKWIAYQSDEAGRPDVLIQRFPATGGKQLISKEGGYLPFWSPDGAELFFTSRAFGLAVVSVTSRQSFTFGVPNPLPVRFFIYNSRTPRNIDISPDGSRFLAVVTADQAASSTAPQIQVVLNWFRELKDRVRVK